MMLKVTNIKYAKSVNSWERATQPYSRGGGGVLFVEKMLSLYKLMLPSTECLLTLRYLIMELQKKH